MTRGIRIGNTTINKLYVGNTEIRRAYLGGILIHDTTVVATAPAAFAPTDWDTGTGTGNAEIDIQIINLPDNGGSPITALEYRLDTGAWQDLGGIVPDTYIITAPLADTAYDVKVRAVNAIDPGPDSDTKNATSGSGAAPSLPPELVALGDDLLAWYDLKDSANLFTGTNFSGAVSNGSIVGSIGDKAGANNDWGLVVSNGITAGPTWNSADSGYLDVPSAGGFANAGVKLTVNVAQSLPDGMELYVGIKLFAGTDITHMGTTDTAPLVYAGLVMQGNSSPNLSSGVGTPTYWRSDPQVEIIVGNRAAYYNALSSNDPLVSSLRDLDMAASTAGSQKFVLLSLGDDRGSFDGLLTEIILTKNLDAKATERANMVTWMTGRL